VRSALRLQRSITKPYFGLEQAAVVLGVRGLHSRISRMLASGELLQLKRGFFVFAAEYRTQPIELFPIANLLYGPSYVSLESALSHYGMIPEGVPGVTSITIRRVKRFDTPLGRFQYRVIHERAFGGGVRSQRTGESAVLLATPEKALLDKWYLDGAGTELLDFSLSGLRIEPAALKSLDRQQLAALARSYEVAKFTQQVDRMIESLKCLECE
jgi:predicted transcriptional regulator of viral defense system